MILLALVVGGVTAWYLGVQAGVTAAIVAAVALLGAMFVPGAALPVYALLLLWTGGLWFWKTKLAAFGQPKEPEKKGWERELDRWKKRAAWLWNNRK